MREGCKIKTCSAFSSEIFRRSRFLHVLSLPSSKRNPSAAAAAAAAAAAVAAAATHCLQRTASGPQPATYCLWPKAYTCPGLNFNIWTLEHKLPKRQKVSSGFLPELLPEFWSYFLLEVWPSSLLDRAMCSSQHLNSKDTSTRYQHKIPRP